jgi:hypothetical protein
VTERFIGAGCHAAGTGRDKADGQIIHARIIVTAKLRHFFIPPGTAALSHRPHRLVTPKGDEGGDGAQRPFSRQPSTMANFLQLFDNFPEKRHIMKT